MTFHHLKIFFLIIMLTISCKTTSSNRINTAGGTPPGAESFVKVSNGKLVLDGNPYNFVGSNFYRLALSDAFGSSVQKVQLNGKTDYSQIDQVLKNYARNNIRVIRLWGFSCEASRGARLDPPLIYRNFTYSDSALEQLDYTIAAAGRNGLKVILPFVNFEPEYCGWEWWVENAFAQASSEEQKRLTYSCTNLESHKAEIIVRDPKDCQGFGQPLVTRELFLSDPLVIKAYKNHLRTMLQRTNPYNGKAYKDDPAIMAIEVSNEPHTTDTYECMVTDIGKKTYKGCSKEEMSKYNAGKLVHNWIADISSYIKTIDKNHLVASGEEGYRTDHDDPSCRDRYDWIHNGSKGVDFVRNASIPTVDLMTTHLYPDNWGVATSDLPWFERCIIRDRAAIASRNNKPIIMEESGFNEKAYADKPDAYASNRDIFIGRMFDYATSAGFQGVMIWQLDPLTLNNENAEKDSFTFPIGFYSADGQFTYTREGAVVTRKAACFEDSATNCAVFGMIEGFPNCMKDSQVKNGVGTIKDAMVCGGFVNTRTQFEKTGSCECRVAAALSQRAVVICPAGTKEEGGWGWTKDKSICKASSKTLQQFASSGGCSCTIGANSTTGITASDPICPSGTKLDNGWGWTTDAGLCQKSNETKKQFTSAGGCSCTAKGN